MPRIGPARMEARRRQILDAAVACFARKGFHKATMRDVVAESGLSPGSIYCHFSSKREIVNAVVAARHHRDRTLVFDAAGKSSLEACLVQLTDDFLGTLSSPGDRSWRRLAVQLWAEGLNDAGLLKVVRGGAEQVQTILAERIRQAQASGEGATRVNPAALARILMALFQGLALQTAWDADLELSECIATIRKVLATGLETF